MSKLNIEGTCPALSPHNADDWKKIKDKTLRKTVQNRLAQRKRSMRIMSYLPVTLILISMRSRSKTAD